MQPYLPAFVYALLLFAGMFIMLEAGRRWGIKRRPSESESDRGGLGTIEGALFALFGLILAFTFSGAAGRFNEKRMLIADEANAIGTAYLRIHLVAPEGQPELRELFRRYTDSRLEVYRRLPDLPAAQEEMARTAKIQDEIWTRAVALTRHPDSQPQSALLLLPALNGMFDIATTRTMSLRIHPPGVIYALMFILGLICALLAGYRMSSTLERSWIHILAFTIITVVTVYVILDIEYPRAGLIRLEASDQVLVSLRESMK
jgi:hypothetical protein